MRDFIASLILFFGSHSIAQTYVLDESFGTQGAKYFPGNSFVPTGGFAYNGNYFFNSDSKIAKVDSDGNFATDFGVGGFISPYGDESNFQIIKIKLYNNQIYILGALYGDSTRDPFICRLDENGIFDTSFGNSGKAVIDLGQSEFVSDFVVEPSGKIFCIGDRYNSSTSSTRLIYFKLNANGSLDMTFDSNGFKVFHINYTTIGYFISEYNGGYLLAGATKVNENYVSSDMLLLKVDYDGNIDSGFGNNGSKSIQGIGGFSFGFCGIDATGPNQLYDNKLYFRCMRQSGFNYIYGATLVFDLATDQVNRFGGPYQSNYFKASADGLLVTGYNSMNCVGNPLYACHNTFNLRKEYLDASSLDPSFQNNSVYNYSFPSLTESNCRSHVFLKGDDGKILIAGYSFVSSTPTWRGFSMIRLREGLLNTSDVNEQQAFSVMPNPFDQKVEILARTPVKSVSIFDLQGRNVATPVFNSLDKSINLDLSELKQSGTYLMKITTIDGQTATCRVIKK